MSGICAIWRKDGAERAAGVAALLSAELSLSDREHNQSQSDRAAGVGVSARFAGQQVFKNERVLVACDADLSNEDELAGIVGEKRPAAELIAALYERLGAASIEKLRGAFSVIVWDRIESRWHAAVDGFGIKRLVYYEDAKMLVISSRIDAMTRSGALGALEIHPPAIANVLNFSCNLAPDTIYKKIRRLAPGTMLSASEGQTRTTRYWDMRYGAGRDSDEGRLSRELESVVESAVAGHCHRSGFAALGAFLSGGTDSSTVVGMMTRAASGPVKAFSIGFEEQPFNELEYAGIAARRFGSEHHTYLVGARDCFEALPEMVRYFDEPFGNSSAIPTYFCARLAAQNGVTTLLAGDGGDELFGGNERYATDQLFQFYQRVPRWVQQGMIEPALGAIPISGGLFRKARGYVRRANMPGVERMLSFQFLRTHALSAVFEGDFLRALGGYSIVDVPARHYAEAPARDHLDRLLYVDAKITLADNDLPKVTCMTELAGVETRFPFLDREVAEFSGRIPPSLKVKWMQKRYLFKKAFRNLLPGEIIAKKKHGFGIPVANWLKSDPRMRELARDTLLSRRAFERGYFRRAFIEELFQKSDGDQTSYYGDTLWTFLALELWHRHAADEPARKTA
jgi:asparagine synthase (glutamine-hydrolysing)